MCPSCLKNLKRTPVKEECTCGRQKLQTSVCSKCTTSLLVSLDIKIKILEEFLSCDTTSRDMSFILGKLDAYKQLKELVKK